MRNSGGPQAWKLHLQSWRSHRGGGCHPACSFSCRAICSCPASWRLSFRSLPRQSSISPCPGPLIGGLQAKDREKAFRDCGPKPAGQKRLPNNHSGQDAQRPRLSCAGIRVVEWFGETGLLGCHLIGTIFSIRCRSTFRKDFGLQGQRPLTPFRFYTVNVTSPAPIIRAPSCADHSCAIIR
jgi:hypothetical protein